jgi:class 3 adenylate cyclase/tetratricopeptide (TPR) repeat protein/ABC-type ATPase involved in cell division
VLFADIVGFTSLSEHRDPERVKAILDRCFARLAADVTACGGRVDKIVGDAMVALFGAPVAHEDDAERAVRAALQMQRGLSEQQNGDVGFADLSVRVGINTGEVLVGVPRSGEYTATGDVVNVASRLQTMARPGQVVVGPGTWAATRDAVRYVALGAVAARGREELVDAWQAVEAIGPPGHRPARPRAPLVGRDEELALIRSALATCMARRRAHLVLLLGEAGVGKSRLAEELVGTARCEYGATVLEGRCVPYGEANAWWPLAEALRQACGITPSDTAEISAARCQAAVADAMEMAHESPDVERIVDGLLHVIGQEARMADVDPARVSEEDRRAVTVFLEALARNRPLVLAISELHWADDAVLDALDRLLDTMGSRPFLLLATARPNLEGRWKPRPGRHNSVLLTVDPLDDEAADRLLGSLLGSLLDYEPAADVRSLLLERGGGNPLFLEELTSLLDETGLAARGASSGGTLVELPATLRGLVAARLDALSIEERAVLEDAAVVGRTGPVFALAALATAAERDDPSDPLHGLVVRDLLLVDAGEFAFRSDLLREVAYETLTKAQRARRHSALAAWLSERMRLLNREDEELEQVAHHYRAAAHIGAELGPLPGVPVDIATVAIEALTRAAARAEQRDLHSAAVRLLDDAMALAGEGDALRRDVLLARAKARAATHDLNGARADLEQVQADAVVAGDSAALARALIVQGDIEQREGHFAAAADTLKQAAGALGDLGDLAGAAEAVRRMGMALLVGGNAEAAEAPITEALRASRALGLRRDEAWALQNLAWIAFTRGQLGIAEERLHESMVAFADASDYGGISWALGLLGWVRLQQGRLDEAESLAVQITDELRDHGDRWARAMMAILLASVRLWRGFTAEGAERARAAIDQFAAMGDPFGQIQAMVPRIRALLARGRVDDGLATLAAAEALAARDRDPNVRSVLMTLEVNAACQLGDPQRAHRVPVGSGPPPDAPEFARGEVITMLGLVALQEGDAVTAAATVEQALAELSPDAPAAFAHSTLALVRAASGQPDAADAAAALVAADGRASYHDRAIALVARGFAARQHHDPAGRDAAFAGAAAEVDSTGDILAQALIRLAWARAKAADAGSGCDSSEDATVALADAHLRLGQLGVQASGWDTAFQLAARAQTGGRPPSPVTA